MGSTTVVNIPSGSTVVVQDDTAKILEFLNAASTVTEAVGTANQAALTATQARDDTLLLANVTGPTAIKKTFLEASALNSPNGSVLHILIDEQAQFRRTARVSDGTNLGDPIYLDDKTVIRMSEYGFLQGNTAAALTANQAAWAALKVIYADKHVHIYVDGQYYTDIGFHWEDRVLPVELTGIVFGAEIRASRIGVIPVRIGGIRNGKRTALVRSRGVNYRGAWNEDNGWQVGAVIRAGNQGGWTNASAFEVYNCDRYESYGDGFYDSEYDGPSVFDNVGSFHIENFIVSKCRDDGIGPGGFTTDMDGNVENGIVRNGLVLFCKNVGLHSSGNAHNIIFENITIRYCGKRAFDVHGDNITFRNITGEWIGMPKATHFNYNDYPDKANFGNVAAGGQASAFSENVDNRVCKNLKIESCVVKNVFDKTDRACVLLDLTPTSGGSLDGAEIDLIVDQRGLVGTDYVINNHVPINTGSSANNRNLTHSKVKYTCIFPPEKPGGKSLLTVADHADFGETFNEWDITIIEINDSAGRDAIDLQAQGFKNAKITLREVQDGILSTESDVSIELDCRSVNNISPTIPSYAFKAQGDDNRLINPHFQNSGVLLDTANNFYVDGDLTYFGEQGQEGALFSNVNGSGSTNVDITGAIRGYQRGLGSGDDNATLIDNRGTMSVGDVDFVCEQAITFFNNTEADAVLKVKGGFLKTNGRAFVDIAGNGGSTIKLEVESDRTSGQEVIARADNTFLDLLIRRNNQYATSPIQLSGTRRCFIRGACINTGATAAVQEVNPTGTNDFSQMALLN